MKYENLRLIDECEGPKKLKVEVVEELPRGRAGLVRELKDVYTGELIKDKILDSTALSKLSHLLFFQSYFPYATRKSAALSAYFIHKILRPLTEFRFGYPVVPDSRYVRWSPEHKAFALGTDFIEGRGPKPGPIYEIDELMKWMDKIKRFLEETGFIGILWQSEPGGFGVAPSNFIYTEVGEIKLVDATSAFVNFSGYGKKYGYIPSFDDVDFGKLFNYINSNEENLTEGLGKEEMRRLRHHAKALKSTMGEWKEGEWALFRGGLFHRIQQLIKNEKGERDKVRKGLIEHLTRKYGIAREEVEKDPYRYLRYGISWDIEKFIESSRLYKFVTDPEYRKEVKRKVIEDVEKIWELRKEGYRIKVAKDFMDTELNRWLDEERISKEDVGRIKEIMDSGAKDVEEYFGGMGIQWGWWFADKVVGLPSTVGSIGLFLATWNPYSLLPLAVSPSIRTVYTLWRKIKNRDVSYKIAGLVGTIPVLGNWGYPLQLSRKHPEIFKFLTRSVASKIGRKLPIIGGKDTRVEHWLIKRISKISEWIAGK